MYQNSNMTLRIPGHFSVFGQVSSGIARQRSLEKFAILSLKPQRHVRIKFLIYWSLRLGRFYVEWHYARAREEKCDVTLPW